MRLIFVGAPASLMGAFVAARGHFILPNDVALLPKWNQDPLATLWCIYTPPQLHLHKLYLQYAFPQSRHIVSYHVLLPHPFLLSELHWGNMPFSEQGGFEKNTWQYWDAAEVLQQKNERENQNITLQDIDRNTHSCACTDRSKEPPWPGKRGYH